MDDDDPQNAQAAMSDSPATLDASQQLNTNIPVATYHLPSEVLLPILVAVPFSEDQYQIFKNLNPRIREMVESGTYRVQVACQNFPELSQLFNMYAPDAVVSEEMLLWFARTARTVRRYSSIICEGFPQARREIVRQGLYVTEAKRILRSRLNNHPIPGHVRDIWDNLTDTYTAAAVRYTVWRVFQHIARLPEIDEHFSVVYARGESDTPSRAILRATFEVAVLYQLADHDGISIVSLLKTHMYRTGQLMLFIKRLFTRLLVQAIECEEDPTLWALSGRLLLREAWDAMQYYPKITDIIEAGEDEDSFAPTDTNVNFWRRETDCALSLVNKFEDRQEPVEEIDFLAIGKVLRGEQ